MKMGPISIGFGLALIALGAGFYFAKPTITALIPAFFGLPLIIFGVLAAKESLRMHVMHAAALIGVIGFLGGLGMAIPAALKEEIERPLAVIEQAIMGVVCAVFVGFCVKSFIDARKARQQEEQAQAGVQAPQS